MMDAQQNSPVAGGSLLNSAATGSRQDGTTKGEGYFGPLKRPDGGVSSELSFDTEIDGKKIFGPLIVPTLSGQELNSLLSGGKPTEEIYRKATDHALRRIKTGKSPFAGSGERVPYPK